MHHNHGAGHQHHHKAMEKRQDPGTVVQYVYKTASKTFDGPIGGYMTEGAPQAANTPDSNPDTNSNTNSNPDNSNAHEQQVAQQAAQQSAEAEAEASSSAVAAAIAEASASDAAAAATQVQQQTQATPTDSSKAPAKNSTTSSPRKAVTSSTQTPVAAATSSPTSSPSPTSSYIEPTSSPSPSHSAAASTGASGGMSSGGKAGLAIGILLAIGALFALAFFIYRRRRSQSNEDYAKADDEKSAYTGNLARSQSTVSTRTTATAPRLSLRPVTEFHPDLAARAATAGGTAGRGAAAGTATAKKGNDSADPFGNQNAVKPSQRDHDEKAGLPTQFNASENPFTDNAGAPAPTNRPIPPSDAPAPLRIRTPSPGGAAAAGVAASVGALAGAGLVERDNAPKPLELSPNRPNTSASHSPAVSEFSQTPISPGATANGPPPSNVHRIQLDFKPSMDDELSLRAGQLVRLLHEYDDGWALCIRLDRSQQGVAPRTCLSARPVKPRPPPGARGPGPRGPPPLVTMGPGQQRPASPAGGRGSPSSYGRAPRSMGPGPAGRQQRSMSPGPYGGGPQRPANIPPPGAKRRSNSASDVRDRRMSPPGPSPMNPNVQRVPMLQQATNSPDSASITTRSPPTSMMPPRKPVPGQAM